MLNYLSSGSSCPISAFIGVLLWWLTASALLYFSWNYVVSALTSAKQAKFWHALLIVATLAAFCAPRYMCKGKRGCPYSKGKAEVTQTVTSEGEKKSQDGGN